YHATRRSQQWKSDLYLLATLLQGSQLKSVVGTCKFIQYAYFFRSRFNRDGSVRRWRDTHWAMGAGYSRREFMILDRLNKPVDVDVRLIEYKPDNFTFTYFAFSEYNF